MVFTNRLVIRDSSASGGYSGVSSANHNGLNQDWIEEDISSYWFINSDGELAPTNEERTVKANNTLTIGDFQITATETGLSITKKDGTVAHLFCSGEITAYKQ